MPRPKEFDREVVLDRAMQLFWQRGYEATSIGDLVEHLGIGRQSLYDTFGDKRALYLASLDHYRDSYGDVIPELLEGTGDVRTVIRRAFDKLIDGAAGTPSRACMLTNAVAERCPDDVDVGKRFCANNAHLERAFSERLLRARSERQLSKRHDPEALAAYLMNALRGLQVAARGGMKRTALSTIIDTTLAALD